MKKTVHGVVDRQLVAAEFDATKRVWVKCPEDLDNGSVVALGDTYMDGEKMIYEASKADKGATLSAIAILANPEVMADERLNEFSDYYNKKGQIVLVDIVEPRNVLAMTKECLNGDVAVGKFVELDGSYKLKVVAIGTAGSLTVGKIIDVHEGKYGVYITGTVAA